MPLTNRDRGQTSIPSDEGVARVLTPLSWDEVTSVDLDKLCPHETIWPRKQPFLASKGYHLRPRFQPGWTPSWIQNPTLDRENCPDYVELPVSTHSFVLQICSSRRSFDLAKSTQQPPRGNGVSEASLHGQRGAQDNANALQFSSS